MKQTKSTIKDIVGFTQEEMSILLGINRSQWAMYETGKRSLPIEPLKKLTDILLHLENSKGESTAKQNILRLEKEQIQKWLAKEQMHVEYKEKLLNIKILKIENKRKECFNALEVVRFLESTDHDVGLLKMIKSRIMTVLEKNALQHIEKLQFKKEGMLHSKIFLEKINDRNSL